MAYASSGLGMLATSDGWTLWVYKTTDAIATVNSASYFTGDAVDMLSVRDMIIVVDTNAPTTSFVTVLSNDGSAVDVSDGTAVAETDSD